MILDGRVRVNGRIVKELGTQVDPIRDRVEVNGRRVHSEKKTYVVLNKPRGYTSDRDESSGKQSALDLVHAGERLYAAGRLDANSEGLLLLTNDGELAHRITHPRYEHDKEYLVLVEGELTARAMEEMRQGVWYDGELLRADSAKRAGDLGEFARTHHLPQPQRNETWLRIVLHEGKKREIRHMCAALGLPVKRLIRVRIGPIRLGDLVAGKWRELNEGEVRALEQIGMSKSQQPRNR